MTTTAAVQPPEPIDRQTALARVSIGAVRTASARLTGVIEPTPVIRSGAVDEACGGATVALKCESMQPIGAFKIRGAYNAMSLLSDEAKRRGVLAYSSGNHAQAVAMAGGLLGVRTVILMPSDAPRIKLAATRARLDTTNGSRVEVYDPKTQRRETLAAEIAEREGLTIVPPYDHPDIICGQATAALELFENCGDLDYLFVPTGGGGLLAGCATVAKTVAPRCKVIGVEPALADDAARSFRSGKIEVAGPDAGGTICDGARTPFVGAWTFPVIRERVDGIITASDAEVSRAMRTLMEKARLVVEPTGALGLAGAMKMREEFAGKTVGVIVSGGNVDLDEIPRLLAIGDRG